MAFSEIRGPKSEVGSQGSEDRFQRSEIRSKELYNPHFFHQHPTSVILHLFSALCILVTGFRIPNSPFNSLSSVICLLSFPVPINLFQYFGGHIISQLHRFIGMFGSQIILPFFQVGDGQVIVGRRKVCIELNGL
jgi:hypothetical protein